MFNPLFTMGSNLPQLHFWKASVAKLLAAALWNFMTFYFILKRLVDQKISVLDIFIMS